MSRRNLNFLVKIYWALAFGVAGPVMAQVTTVERIAATQGGSSALQFKLPAMVPLIDPGDFYDPAECTVRSGLPVFITKLKKGEALTIAFIGGSITQNELSYRLQTARYIQSMNQNSSITWINAGIAGTGADLGACRLREQVLTFKPDLVLIEFAVNGALAEGVEGMIRQLKKQSPTIGICLIYTIIASQVKTYQSGMIPANISALESVAMHYNIPSIHLAMEAATLEKNGRLIWQSTQSDNYKTVFSRDGIHPSAAGGNLYAAAIARGLKKMEKENLSSLKQPLPEPLFQDNWQDAHMFEPSEIATFSEGWIKKTTAKDSLLKGFKDWLSSIMYTESPGSSFSFQFKGDKFGLFDIGGPEAGFYSVELDGTEVSWMPLAGRANVYRLAADSTDRMLVNRFNMYCNNRYRGQYVLMQVTPGSHRVTIRLSGKKADKASILGKGKQDDINENPAKYAKAALMVGRVLICGDIIYPSSKLNK